MAEVPRPLKGRAAAAALGLLLGGCTLFSRPPPVQPQPVPSPVAPPLVVPPPPAPVAPVVPAPAPPPPAATRHIELSSASRSLVTLAHTQTAHGDLPAASTTLDRALRIEPDNALLWVELGRLRLAEGDAHQAEGCGRKALALASGDPAAQDLASRLLADAQLAARRAHQ